jgi:hypothetical protein
MPKMCLRSRVWSRVYIHLYREMYKILPKFRERLCLEKKFVSLIISLRGLLLVLLCLIEKSIEENHIEKDCEQGDEL